MGKTQKRFLLSNHEKDLKSVIRYHKFKVMFYRTNLHIHTKRIEALFDFSLPFLLEMFPSLDVKLFRWMIRHHDDLELITGDYPLQLKLLMSPEERNKLKEEEFAALEELSKWYPKKVQGYEYRETMLRIMQKSCLESQILSFIDKIDGYCEALHELLAGNNVFLEPIWNYPHKTFNAASLNEAYPLLRKLFVSDNLFFRSKMVFDIKEYYKSGTIGPMPHNEETLTRIVGFYHYSVWRDVTIRTFGKDVLLKQQEFFEIPNA